MSTPNGRNNGGNNKNNTPENKPKMNTVMIMVILAVVFVLLFNVIYSSYADAMKEEIKYNEFKTMLENGEVEEVEIQADRILILTKEQAELPQGEQIILYTGLLTDEELLPLLEENNVKYYRIIEEEDSFIISLLLSYVIPFALIFLFFNFLMKNVSGKMGGSMSIGQSKAKVYMEKETGVTFADVAGQDEAKESLQEIIDFLHNPQKYAAIGAKIPKGALLVGSPGTG